jgi:hypothetical protein
MLEAFMGWVMGVLHPWALAFRMLVHPLTIFFGVPTVFAFYLSVSTEDKQAAAIWVGLSNIFSGILGGVLVKLFFDSLEEKAIVQRGNLAIRHLSLLISSVTDVRKRVVRYRQISNESPSADRAQQVTDLCFEEIDARCDLVIQQTLNALETWRDVVPGATNFGNAIAEYRELTSRIELLEEERNDLLHSLEHSKGESETNVNKLIQQIKDRDHEIKRANNEIADLRRKASGSISISSVLDTYNSADLGVLRVPTDRNIQNMLDIVSGKLSITNHDLPEDDPPNRK